MSVSVTLGTPLAEELSNVVQPKLVEVGWSSGGLDDSALAEYIILMLVNGKTQEQIAAELSNDLLNLGPDDSGAIDFSRWLFEQVGAISAKVEGGSTGQGSQQTQGQTIPSFSGEEGSKASRQESKQAGDVGSQDAHMGEAMEVSQDVTVYVYGSSWCMAKSLTRNSPTGPKAMKNGPRRNSNKRIIGQISKAMDRTNDSVLHRVRQQGTERINMHNRQPPKGPRNEQNRPQRIAPNGRSSGPSNSMPNGGPAAALTGMTPQQQMQLFAMYEQQARMMSQILSPQQQQAFMPGMPTPQNNQQPGRSLFERVEGRPNRPNKNFNPRPHANGGSPGVNHSNDTEMGGDDLTSSMEVESSQNNTTEPSADTTCKFNLKCTKQDCPFAHQSPAAPSGTSIDVNDHCPFGAACKNRKCVARHPSPAQKVSHQAEQDCKFYPNCSNPTCPFRHPTMPMCRNGADCTRPECKFTHVKTKCRFNPCLNASCPYKHEEGQKRGAFGDKVWVAEGTQEIEHVSERKFVDDDTAEEELIVPGNHRSSSQPSSLGTELVT
ncbi:hypothetical protein MMC09_003967 [Bachmanniomyces sp. S44760]|nr:hypothetical protein [Bachmanniomyces sp. S44760]